MVVVHPKNDYLLVGGATSTCTKPPLVAADLTRRSWLSSDIISFDTQNTAETSSTCSESSERREFDSNLTALVKFPLVFFPTLLQNIQ